jgi:O-antigen/teichoic acid export membrane protein
MGLFSMLQLGFLNGGYRIFSENHKDSWVVNDIVYSYFLIIESIVIFGIFLMHFWGSLNNTNALFAILASFFGILLVLNNWIRNILIAEKKLLEVNKLNLTSTLFSFIFLTTVPFWGLYGALLVTFSVELIFFTLAIFRSKYLLPRKFNFQWKQYKWVLSFGFLPFLAGVISTYNAQVETWSIASFISTEALGAFYLPTLYISLFLLIPSAVSQLFYPDAIKSYTETNYKRVKKILKIYFLINLALSILIVFITLAFIELIIGHFVPKHLVGIPYVWLILPGLIIYTIKAPVDLIFYAANMLGPFLWTSIIGVAFTTIGLLTAGFLGSLSLSYVATIKSLFYIVTSLCIIPFYVYKRESIWKPEFASLDRY